MSEEKSVCEDCGSYREGFICLICIPSPKQDRNILNVEGPSFVMNKEGYELACYIITYQSKGCEYTLHFAENTFTNDILMISDINGIVYRVNDRPDKMELFRSAKLWLQAIVK